MNQAELTEKETKEILEAAALVKHAGHGEVVIKYADHVIVNIRYEATRALTKQDR